MTAAASRLTRRLAVILHADVAESTLLVRYDESLAHERITQTFVSLGNIVRRYGGRVQEIRGDALLAEFERASDAVCAALEFQQDHSKRLDQYEDGMKPAVRVGISMGEVIIADDTVTGEGVVLAQRVEQLAAPGGISITAAIREALPSRMPFEFRDRGGQRLKGFDEAVRVHSVVLRAGSVIPPPDTGSGVESGSYRRLATILIGVAFILLLAGSLFWNQSRNSSEDSVTAETPLSPASDMPSIAVLPFDNLSDDPAQEYFSDGVSEDIITDLSQIEHLFVIARNSSFSYKGRSTKVQEIGRDLKARYLLEGSVRKDGDRLRITAQLIETASGHHLWARRYDRKLTDVFAVQDEITREIVSALAIELSVDDAQRLASNATADFEAYDVFLKGLGVGARFTEEGMGEAISLFRTAIELDPDFARAYGALSVLLNRQVNAGFSDTPVETKERALELARTAVALDPNSPQALWALGYSYMYRRQYDEAIEALEKAVALSPSYADGYGLLALLKSNIGRPEETIELIGKGMALNPYYSYDYLYNLGRAHYALGDHARSLRFLQQALERNETPSQPRLFLIASYVRLGQLDDAEWEVDRLGFSHPDITLSHVQNVLPISDSKLLQKLTEDLRAAGLAE